MIKWSTEGTAAPLIRGSRKREGGEGTVNTNELTFISIEAVRVTGEDGGDGEVFL